MTIVSLLGLASLSLVLARKWRVSSGAAFQRAINAEVERMAAAHDEQKHRLRTLEFRGTEVMVITNEAEDVRVGVLDRIPRDRTASGSRSAAENIPGVFIDGEKFLVGGAILPYFPELKAVFDAMPYERRWKVAAMNIEISMATTNA